MAYPRAAPETLEALRSGLVIPAHPLALTAARKLDERRQRAMTRYYLDAGAGGLAVAVHTTQFALRNPEHGLLEPVLRLAAETAREWRARRGAKLGPSAGGAAPVLVAGLCGETRQAVAEAELAASLGYELGLLSLAALRGADDEAVLAHCRRVAEVIPLFGFYLQPAVGGRVLGLGFWRRFLEIPNVAAVKVAPFNRYQTLEVVRAAAESGRAGEVALYTGNDDHILLDLLAEYEMRVGGEPVRLRFVGGLLGHWAVWTRRAVEHLERVRRFHRGAGLVGAEGGAAPGDALGAAKDSPSEGAEGDPGDPGSGGAKAVPGGSGPGAAEGDPRGSELGGVGSAPGDLLILANQITEANAAIFDPGHGFAGCIPGIHEVLRRQGLLLGVWCLDPAEGLSPGQAEEIDRVCRAYPHLTDDDFVAEHLDEWLS